MARHYKDWIESCASSIVGNTIPKLYRPWASMVAISAALDRSVYFDHGDYLVRPNLYVVLVGPPGVGKTIAIKLPIDLVFERLTEPLEGDKETKAEAEMVWKQYLKDEWSLPRYMLNGRVTFEKLSRNLSKVQHRVERSKGVMNASLLVRTGEFGLFMSRNDKNLHMLLTEGWDAGDHFDYSTKHEGSDRVLGPCVTWIGCATPSEFTTHMPANAAEQGLLSRIIPVVYRGDKMPTEARAPTYDTEIVEKLAEDLGQIAELSGSFVFAKGLEDTVVTPWLNGGEKPCPSEPMMAEYNSRRYSHLLKMSLCFSAARRSTKIIELEDWESAQKLLFETERHMPSLLRRFGMSDAGKLADNLVDFVKKSGGKVSKRAITREAMRGAKSLSDISKTLELLIDSGSLEQIDDLYVLKNA